MSTVSFMTLLASKKDPETSYLKFNIGPYGVKEVKVTLNDGTQVDVSRESVCFVNDPREGVEYNRENGKITEEKAEEIIRKIDEGGILRDIKLKVE